MQKRRRELNFEIFYFILGLMIFLDGWFFLDFCSFFVMSFWNFLGLNVFMYLVMVVCVLGLMDVSYLCCVLESLEWLLMVLMVVQKCGCMYFLYRMMLLWNWGSISYVVMVSLMVEQSGIYVNMGVVVIFSREMNEYSIQQVNYCWLFFLNGFLIVIMDVYNGQSSIIMGVVNVFDFFISD